MRLPWLQYVILALVGFVVRMPALQGQLVWDDQFLAHDNPFIKSPLFVFEVFRHHLFLDSFSAHYRPVQNLSFIVDYFFWNTDTYGFHLTNILLHVGSGLLLFALLQRLLGKLIRSEGDGPRTSAPRCVALGVAFLWLVHPVHSAAIDYISGRADSLAFLFACAAWLLILRARRAVSLRARILFFLAAATSALLALCSREIACLWIALFLGYEFTWERHGRWKTRMVTALCCLLLVGIYGALRAMPEQRPGPGPSAGWSKSMRAVLMLRALGDYGRLMIYPANLHMERSVFDPDNYRGEASWRGSIATEYLSAAGFVLLGAFAFGAFKKGAGQQLRIFGAGWFLVAYLPISNLFDLNATCAEHWLYLPSVGFLLFAAGSALELRGHWRAVAFACTIIAGVGLSVRSAVRSSDWINAETFYQRTLAAGGNSMRVQVNLAQIYSARGEYAKAEKMFRDVLALTPDYPIARNNLADVLYRQGKTEEAAKLFAISSAAAEQSRKEYPRTWIAALNLAHVRHAAHDEEGALRILEKASADYPRIWELISFESEVLRVSKGPGAAAQLVHQFAQENWWHHGAALALGKLYAEANDVEKADEALRHASRLDVHDVQALNLITLMRVRANRLDDAYSLQRRAVSRQPDEPRQYALLSDILLRLGRADEARAATAQFARLQSLADHQVAAN